MVVCRLLKYIFFKCGITFSALVFVFCIGTSSWASIIHLIEESPGVYRIDGEGLDKVAALDILIDYDTYTLEVSRVTQGALLQGMLFAGNPNQSGRVRISAVGTEAVSGSGTLAVLNGIAKISGPKVLRFTANLRDISGKTLQSRAEYPMAMPIETPSASEDESQVLQEVEPRLENVENSPTSVVSQNRSGALAEDPIVFLPFRSIQETETAIPIDESLNPIEEFLPNNTPTSDESSNYKHLSGHDIEKLQIKTVSVLESFKVYDGVRSFEKMAPLFRKKYFKVQQRPEIYFSDGQTHLALQFQDEHFQFLSMALVNARLIGTEVDSEGHFVLRCIPEKGALSAKIFLLGSDATFEIPLTVSPKINTDAIEVADNKPLPHMDLNDDGECNWRDDYILVSNLLAKNNPD